MTDEEMIDWLRRSSSKLDPFTCEYILQVADRIEAQAAEIARLEWLLEYVETNDPPLVEAARAALDRERE